MKWIVIKQLTLICILEGMGTSATVTLACTVVVLRRKRNLIVFLNEKFMVVVLHTVLEKRVPAVMLKQTGVTQESTVQMFNRVFPT